MNSGKDKKLTVYTKNVQNKKPNLQIDTNADNQPVKTTGSNPTISHPEEINNNKGSLTMTSPSNFKNPQNINVQTPQSQSNQAKKQVPQKKTSQKEQPTVPKIQFQSKMTGNFTTNGFVSPKAALNKQKILNNYPSEKNLANIKLQKRQSNAPRDTKAIKIEELQKIVQESKIKQSQLSIKEAELQTQVQKLRTENNQLRTQNSQLKKKIEKYKISSEQTKKMLKQRIHTFNQESGEMQAVKNQIKTLEERVESLLQQNQALKAEINKFSDFNLKDLSNLQGLNSNAFVVSNVREVHMQGSRVSQLYLKQSNERDLLQFTNMQNMEENLDLQSYISQAEESYIEQYKTNVDIFDKIKHQYQQILQDIEIRYKTLSEEYQQAAKQQAAQIQDLQYQIDQLQYEQKEGKRNQSHLSMSVDEMILRNQKEIATLNLTIYNLRDTNKQLVGDVQHHRAQCRFLQAELDIERMKKKFKNQNDKFEYNVVKLNLLTIIDKLKMQIDKHKQKYNKISEKYKPEKKYKNQIK